jgi:hypothetical protein
MKRFACPCIKTLPISPLDTESVSKNLENQDKHVEKPDKFAKIPVYLG